MINDRNSYYNYTAMVLAILKIVRSAICPPGVHEVPALKRSSRTQSSKADVRILGLNGGFTILREVMRSVMHDGVVVVRDSISSSCTSIHFVKIRQFFCCCAKKKKKKV